MEESRWRKSSRGNESRGRHRRRGNLHETRDEGNQKFSQEHNGSKPYEMNDYSHQSHPPQFQPQPQHFEREWPPNHSPRVYSMDGNTEINPPYFHQFPPHLQRQVPNFPPPQEDLSHSAINPRNNSLNFPPAHFINSSEGAAFNLTYPVHTDGLPHDDSVKRRPQRQNKNFFNRGNQRRGVYTGAGSKKRNNDVQETKEHGNYVELPNYTFPRSRDHSTARSAASVKSDIEEPHQNHNQYSFRNQLQFNQNSQQSFQNRFSGKNKNYNRNANSDNNSFPPRDINGQNNFKGENYLRKKKKNTKKNKGEAALTDQRKCQLERENFKESASSLNLNPDDSESESFKDCEEGLPNVVSDQNVSVKLYDQIEHENLTGPAVDHSNKNFLKPTKERVQQNKKIGLRVEDVEQILKLDTEEVVKNFADDETRFSKLFIEDLEPEMLVLFVQLLGKVCLADVSTSPKKVEILRKASSPQFLNKLFTFVSKAPYIQNKALIENLGIFFNSALTFYDTLLDLRPSEGRLLNTHLLELKKAIKTAQKKLNFQPESNLLTSVQELLDNMTISPGHDENKDENAPKKKANNTYFPEPVGNFRTVDLFPRPEDIFAEQPYLYPNVVEGPYRSVEQYLDTQFKLLREDFMGPIRQAVKDYKRKQNTKDKFKRVENVRIYYKVKFLHPKTIQDKVGYEVCFDVENRLNRVNWEFSNRFMFGSLLLFTNNHFDSFFLATVSYRDIKQLTDKRVTVELKGTLPNVKSILGKEFVMAESEAYFEPYYNVLKALQNFNEQNFPLAKYIVHVATDTLPPKYLSREDMYQMKGFNFRVLDDRFWPSHIDLGLDLSQYEAFKAALTNELVVIQGPPGTGKTFLGLKIAQSLLENSFAWNKSSCPILVVCLTNHALDQFLEGLLPFTSKLVRIGGKSKGKELDKFNIRERRREFSYYQKTKAKEVRELNLQMSKVFAEINTFQMNIKQLDDVEGILSLNTLQLAMQKDCQRAYLKNDDHLMEWLLGGVGMLETELKVKVKITADGGIVKETSSNDSHNEAEDDRLKQAFFNNIELEEIPPSEDTVVVHYSCTLDAINDKLKEISQKLSGGSKKFKLSKFELGKLESTRNKLASVLTHLRKELKENRKFPQSEVEKKTLLNETILGNLQPAERWKLYHIWVDILKNGLIVELQKKEKEFKESAFRFEQLRQVDDLKILQTSHVVGTTTNTAAKLQPLFTALAPKIVIVEEAAEVLESHVIASLTTSCEHLILIGDHKQLRPSVAEVWLARQYHLDVSLFERMVNNGMSCYTLTLQHRMRPEISKQLVPTIYPTLRDDVSVLGRDNIKGMDKNVFFMTHSHFEDEVVEITSKRNRYEAEMVLNLARYLVLQGYKPSDITILATYKGQMYHMKNQIKNMNGFPKGIQITVVDNFQGEENKIIILSLVRSNALEKIGFLEIENRVCVALSRARDGLYIFGNMQGLTSSSKIWPHIKKSLVDQNAFGPTINLRCQNHPDQVTSIKNVEDWIKVSEGGCSLICGQVLACGHFCKSMCHTDQDYHFRNYRCREPCPKILCDDGHQCPKKCHDACGSCKVPVHRTLPCGHVANVPCSMDIRRFKCENPVQVVVAECRHSVTVPCHSSTDPLCNLPCAIRLECGHTCGQLCHVTDDPDHLEFLCQKACPRLNKDCCEEHRCELLCWEECQLCRVLCQKQLPCGHLAHDLCSKYPQDIQCGKPCERTRRCGHPCDKLCHQPCDPCLVIVEKVVRECGHSVKVPCSQKPTRQDCGAPCVGMLACGHTCAQKCRDPCSTAQCVQLKRYKITTLLCGHTNAQIPCNQAAKVHSMLPEELMQFCAEPCGQELICKHPCSGSCSDCMQGRIHKMCDQPCGNVLICGHSCPVPCREVCPPCNQPCRHQCKHSKCPKKCGEVCSLCNEPCDYACEHLKCTKRCGELCDRKPCYEPCPTLLSCAHPCVGFCGEPCPPCRQCAPEHFELFFYTGEEEEEDSRWIYLEDCKHTLEATGLEYWMNMQQEGKEIVSKDCPKCKTPIVKVQRFMNLVKETYLDIQNVKAQCYGKQEEISKQRRQCLKKIQEIEYVNMSPPGNGIDGLKDLFENLKVDLPEQRRKGKTNKRNPIDAQKSRLLCFLTEFFISLYKRKEETWSSLDNSSKTIVTKKINFLTDLLRKRKMKISEQEMDSFQQELKRLHRVFDFLSYCSSPQYRMCVASSGSGALKATMEADKMISTVAVYDDALDTKVKVLLVKLKEAINSTTEVTDAEKAMINKAMGSSFRSSQKTGHWFKCKKGHVYCITECGGAMQEAVCPIQGCGERIGGRNHTLRADQSLASDMDGARFAAWSDQNNMANFAFQF